MSSDHFASGHWTVRDGEADAFAERWRELLEWTRQHHPGLESATLIRSDADPNVFVSFATWASAEERNDWKRSEDFMRRMSACRELCDGFVGGDYGRVATI